ncbi:MAG: FIST signal transduction protein [Pseudobdellovibrio sp.]
MRTALYLINDNLNACKFDSTLDSANTLIIVFFNPLSNIQELLSHLNKVYPQSIIIGSSSIIQIHPNGILNNKTTVSVTQFEKSTLKLKLYEATIENSAVTGETIGKDFSADKNIKNLLLFCDGLNIDSTYLVNNINNVFEKNNITAPIIGGLAANKTGLTDTYIICKNKVLTHHVVAVAIYSDELKITTTISKGWEPFGPLRTVTKCNYSTVYELDHIPALDIYKSYLKDQVDKLPSSAFAFPLGITWKKNQNIVRTVAFINEVEKSLIFADRVPENSQVQIMHNNVVRLLEEVKNTVQKSLENFNFDKPYFMLIISCAARNALMGQKTEEEFEYLHELSHKPLSFTGFYSFGEIFPTDNACGVLHNQSFTLAIYQE